MLGKSLVGFRTLTIRLRGERFDHLAKGSTHRKQVEKLGFYTFLYVISDDLYLPLSEKTVREVWVFTFQNIVNNEQIQRMLLAESSFDFKKAMKLFQWRLP